MAAHQQLPFCSVEIKTIATDSKAGNETHVGLDMRTTPKDWERLGKLVTSGGISVSLVTMVPIVPVGPHDVGKESDYRNNGTLKKASEEFNRVMFLLGKDDDDSAINFLEDIGLIKCLSVLYNVPNPFLYNPVLDGFELPSQRTCGSNSGEPVEIKNGGICARKFETFKLLFSHYDPSQATKTTEERLTAAVQQMRVREDSDSKKKAKAKERKQAKATEKFNSRKKSKNTEKSDTKLISKTVEVSDSRKKAKSTEQSDSRKRTKAREKSSAKQELKTSVGDTNPGKELMLDESEARKGTDNQEEKASSRPVSKSIRTCMTCGLQEPSPKMFKKCRRCKDEGCPDPPYYCGRDCQVLDWTARHRQEHEKNNAEDTAKS